MDWPPARSFARSPAHLITSSRLTGPIRGTRRHCQVKSLARAPALRISLRRDSSLRETTVSRGRAASLYNHRTTPTRCPSPARQRPPLRRALLAQRHQGQFQVERTKPVSTSTRRQIHAIANGLLFLAFSYGTRLGSCQLLPGGNCEGEGNPPRLLRDAAKPHRPVGGVPRSASSRARCTAPSSMNRPCYVRFSSMPGVSQYKQHQLAGTAQENSGDHGRSVKPTRQNCQVTPL